MPSILMGDNTLVEVCGRGSINVEDGTFHDVPCVPSLSTNLLSVHQITHTGLGKKVEFTPNSVEIHELHNDSTVAVGRENHQSRLYMFSHFVLDPPLTISLTHSNDVIRLWHERFGHLNFHYLHQLNQQSMVTGLPSTLTLESLGIHDRSSNGSDPLTLNKFSSFRKRDKIPSVVPHQGTILFLHSYIPLKNTRSLMKGLQI